MQRKLLLGAVFLAGGQLIGSLGCVEAVQLDDSERTSSLAGSLAPVAEFNPAQRIVPLPNALLMDPATGRVNVPPSCGEQPGSSAEGLRLALNQLDGFGTSRLSLAATLSAPVDLASTEGHVFLVRLAEHGVPLQGFEGPVALDVVAGNSRRFAADCSSSVVPNLTLRPRAPLRGSSTYAVLLARGIRAAVDLASYLAASDPAASDPAASDPAASDPAASDPAASDPAAGDPAAEGALFEPSPTWALVRQAEAPVTFSDPDPSALPDLNATPFDPAEPGALASLRGLDTLWRAHAPLLAALDQLAPALVPGASRADFLLAWAFNTETISSPLDTAVAGSAANQVSTAPGPLVLPAPLAGAGGPLSVEAFYANAIPGVPCSVLGCDAIAAIYTASALSEAPRFTSSSFLQGDDCSKLGALAGGFDDPLKPSKVCQRQLPLLVVLPQGGAPAGGFPTVMFAHGLTRSKEDLLAIAGALARGGIASVAFDAVDHGARAARVSSDATLGCDGAGLARPCPSQFGPTCAPQCFAPLFSPDLPRTRDHLRQTVLDQLGLEAVLRGCAVSGACGALQVDARRLGFLGQSLGALGGGVTAAVSSSIRTAELNAGAADWLQILVDSGTAAIHCPLVDGLIAAGVLEGQPWNGGANLNATCLGEAWKTDPGFLEFAAAARWIWDPIDPVNYASRYQDGRSVLLAEMVDDAVVPNSATATWGQLLGLAPELAARSTPDALVPSPAVVAPGSHWVRYQGLDADPATLFPGNAYSHSSLLAPATPSTSMTAGSGQLGTLRLQLDTVAFFRTHWGAAE